MANFSELSFANGVKFYKNTSTPGIHLDDDFAVNQIKSFERKICYWQKWQTNDSTKLQLRTTIAPASVKVYTGKGVLTEYEFAWTLVASGGALGVNLYECLIDFSSLPEGFYHLYFECTLLSYSVKFVSEKQWVKAEHKNTLLFTYKNSYNKNKVYWITGIEMNFRCEAGIMDYQPESDGSDFIDQIHDFTILEATPFDTFKLYIGEAPGVPNYVAKILNYIFSFDSVRIRKDLTQEGLLYTKPVGEKWEATRVKGFPQYGWATTIHPSVNQMALQFNDNNELEPGIIVAYDIDTNLFSTEPVEIVHITDIETI
jgi:hypothetical protein